MPSSRSSRVAAAEKLFVIDAIRYTVRAVTLPILPGGQHAVDRDPPADGRAAAFRGERRDESVERLAVEWSDGRGHDIILLDDVG